MKFRVQFKDPDGVYDSLERAAEEAVADVKGLDDEEREAILDVKRNKVSAASDVYIKWGEYLVVEFDTEDGSARVLTSDEQD
jgi:hypothetical protein